MKEDVYITSYKFGEDFYIRVEDFRDVVNEIQNKYRNVEKEIKRLKTSRDYWKEKAEKLIKENEYYKKKAREFELALKVEYSDKPVLYRLFFGE